MKEMIFVSLDALSGRCPAASSVYYNTGTKLTVRVTRQVVASADLLIIDYIGGRTEKAKIRDQDKEPVLELLGLQDDRDAFENFDGNLVAHFRQVFGEFLA